MPRRAALALRSFALVGFAGSAWLAAQYAVPPALSACGIGGGCNQVRACWLAHAFGVPLPVLGLVAFAALGGLSQSATGRLRRWLPLAAVAGGVAGAALIVLQRVVCGAFCPYCLVTDGAAIGVAVCALLGGARAPAGPREGWLLGGLAVTAAGLAVLWASTRPTPRERPGTVVAELPAPIAAEQRPGTVTIVEFSDFECPFCRREHAVLKSLLPGYGARVRFVRKHVPLSMHPHAEDAARADCCAEDQGLGDALADALFTADPDDLTPAGCERLAASVGVNLTRYRDCLGSARTTERLASDRAQALASGAKGLPTTFVGHERFDGLASSTRLAASIDRAE